MGFADDVQAYVSAPKSRCSVGKWRAQQDPDTIAEFDKAAADPTLMSKAIWVAMRERGYDGMQQNVSRHRKGDCKCPSLTTSTKQPTASNTKQK